MLLYAFFEKGMFVMCHWEMLPSVVESQQSAMLQDQLFKMPFLVTDTAFGFNN